MCPSNALCPGGYRKWSRRGAWAASDTRDLDVLDCSPPATDRCVRWNVSLGTTQCGLGYLQYSYRCSVCSRGHYVTNDGSCSPCPILSSLWARYQALLWLALAILVCVVVVYAILFVIVKSVGGTLTGGAMRAVNFGVWSLTTAQVFANVAVAASPTVPGFYACDV